CKGFNADFDGDQMAVHLPLSLEAQVEAHTLMLSTNNIFSPANGKPIISPSQDVVMGCYYMTMMLPGMIGEDMVFSSREEVLLAYSLKKVHLQAKIKVRMPEGRWLKTDPSIKGGMLFETTPGRIIFNDIVPKGMPYYNDTLQSKKLQEVISDCYEYLGRKRTIDLLDEMMRIGFYESTRSGLSFAADDLVTPKTKADVIKGGDKEVKKIQDQYDNGQLSADERYNKIIDVWTHIQAEITKKMMEELKNDTRTGGYVNPIRLMADSGARGGEEQIRQLAGMRGLMAKPNGKIIEAPVKANFREGLNVLEYFSSTHGARKGLADTALKTADSGFLTRKLVDVAHNLVITMHDCGTKQGIMKGVSNHDEKKGSLAESIRGRVSCANITNLVTDEVIVRENELITSEIARKIEQLGMERIRVRSAMTCEAENGVCALCYGMDLSTSKLVEEGMAIGIIAAQSIGEPGTQLTMRTFHLGGTASHSAEESELKTAHAGVIRFNKMEVVENKTAGGLLVLSCKNDAGIDICNATGLSRETYSVPEGAILQVREGQKVEKGQTLCTMDPHSKLIMAKTAGIVHFDNIVDGDTVQSTLDPATGLYRRTVEELKGDRHPRIYLTDEKGINLEDYYLPGKSQLEVEDLQKVSRGTILAKTPRGVGGTQDITSGLPRVTEIFEARAPKDPAIICEIDGIATRGEKRHGKNTLIVRTVAKNEEDVVERIYEVPNGKHITVFNGDEVRAGQPLTDGPMIPQDILRISGEEAVQEYLTSEIQNLYRSQNVSINDKHIEVIVNQMLREVKIESGGDTSLLQGDLVDKFLFRQKNRELENCVKITDKGSTDFQVDEIVPRDIFESKNLKYEATGGVPAQCKKPEMARAQTQLLGITRVALLSTSFMSAASFQETPRMLTESALANRVDNLVGLKENVILGRLIPAGTGFRKYQNSEWRYRQNVLEQGTEPGMSLDDMNSFALMNDVQEDLDEEMPPSILDNDDNIPGFAVVSDEEETLSRQELFDDEDENEEEIDEEE
ncbi:MAG: DNA-directed RNA polymerase subunit beta', partial [Planctomycetia bacterium]|nr:DNA-directed RNA polymerase subunit beta' [Planctomycetia bacterium]